jgi:predicted component of type VI protein secretion system
LPEVIGVVIGRALPGISLSRVASPFAVEKFPDGFLYFKLDTTGPYWEGIRNGMKISIYIPETITLTNIKLFVL